MTYSRAGDIVRFVAELPGYDGERIYIYEDIYRERFSGAAWLFSEAPRETPMKKQFLPPPNTKKK